jgi:hypothetical protein
MNVGFNNRLDATYFTSLMLSERQVETFSTLAHAVLPLEPKITVKRSNS